jgi:uncharacterized protein YegJ (DUF2314 family)
MSSIIHFRFAVYFLPVATIDPEVVLRGILKKNYPLLELVPKVRDEPKGMTVAARIEKVVIQNYPPPSVEDLEYLGKGLKQEQVIALQKSRQAIVLDFAHPKAKVWVALRAANMVVEQLARDSKGLIWDEETQEVFTPEAWQQERLSKWAGEIPNIETQTSVQTYQKGEFVRGVSRGMKKAGLPDVVVEDFDWSSESQVGDLINLFCQRVAEGASLNVPGTFVLDLKEIKDAPSREAELHSLKPNGTGVGYLRLKEGKADKDDPDNRLIELAADRYNGPDTQAKKQRLLSCFFGTEDVATNIEHTDEVVEASRKARTQFLSLSEKFHAGLAPGEYIQVKAPFKAPDGRNEWMWVEITHWKNKRIRGVLENDPVLIPDLNSGEVVEIREDDVFDYIHQFPDGRKEGNTTGEIIKKMKNHSDPVQPDLTIGDLAKRISDSGCTPD